MERGVRIRLIASALLLLLLSAIALLLWEWDQGREVSLSNGYYTVTLTKRQYRELERGDFEDLDQMTRFYGIQRTYHPVPSARHVEEDPAVSE